MSDNKSSLRLHCQKTHLRGTSDHVLDEVTMSGGVDDGNIVLRSLKLPESNVDGDTTLTLGLQFVQHPGVLERALARLLGLLLELLDGPLVDTSAPVDQVTSGGGLAGVDVADDDNVDVSLLLTHGELLKTQRQILQEKSFLLILMNVQRGSRL